MSMQVVQGSKASLDFMTSSGTSTENDLLKVKYTRAQPESPDFATVYEGVNQGVDVKITTFIFRVAPEPLVALYDFIMTTFVPNRNAATTSEVPAGSSPEAIDPAHPVALTQSPPEKIRVLVKLASVQGTVLQSRVCE